MRTPIAIYAAVVCSAWVLEGACAQDAQSTETDAQQARVAEALQLSLAGAKSYEFTSGEGRALEFRAEPVLRWSNPERGEIYGNVFVWTDRGRPEVVASLFKWYTPFTHGSHEFTSLAQGEIVARREDSEVWRSNKPGVQLRSVPDAPPPADSPVKRLSQMRQLAQRFAARSTDREGLQLELRLLTQPIYRYLGSGTETEWLDGALFVFVQGTDPEVFLMLEARQRQGTAEWQLGLTRMNSIAFRVTYQDREIWNSDVVPWKDVGSHREPYTSFMIR